MIDTIKNKIKSEINVLKIEIIDESHAHANHSGNTGGGHYKALIISNDFISANYLRSHYLIPFQLFQSL